MFKAFILSLLIIIFSALVLACGGSNKNESHGSITITYDDLNISHNGLVLSNYFFKSKVSGEDSLCVFDIKNNRMVFFDLKDKKPLSSVEFTYNGPNFIGNQVTDFILTSTSILTLDVQFLSIFDYTGEIKKRIDLKSIPGYTSLFRLDKMAKVNDNEVIISIAHLTGRLPGTPIQEQTPLFLRLNLTTEDVSFLSAPYPEDALLKDPNKGYWGITAPVSLIYSDSKLIYSFGFSSRIYEFNLLNEEIKIYDAFTSQTENTKEPLIAELYQNTQELAKFGLGGLNFKNVLYDPIGNRYFRLHSFVDYGSSTQQPSRNAFLTIMNSQFEIIYESVLDKEHIPYALLNNGKLIIKKITEQEGRYDLSLLSIIHK